MIKKILFASLLVVLSLILVMTMRAFMPKYSGMLLFFFFSLLFYGYLWFSVRRKIKKLSPAIGIPATIFYWMPVVMVFCLMVYGFVVPFLEWNLALRTYLQSFILMFFLAEFFPILTLFASDMIRVIQYTVLLFIPERKTSLKSIKRFKPLLITGWVLGIFIFIMMAAGTIFWQFDFRVRQQAIVLKELPPAFDGLKIVQISDVHLGSWGSKQQLQEAMDIITNLHPDVIFFTGDMFNYCTADGKGFEPILKTLHAPDGIYAIMGNHDYGDYISWPSMEAKRKNIEDLKSFYQDLGWKLLLNSHDILKRGTDSIAVIGVQNWGASHRFQRLGDIALAQKGTETMAVQLLLSHDPAHWDSIVRKKFPKIDVTFSGHTHGGQVGIDCCNIHWSPVIWISRLWCGLYKNPDSDIPQYLYVNQGLGNIGYSGRIGILPEITLITLKRN
ncbi:MAG: metallophosphoesterase [Bacteroidota bacterium]